MKNNIEALNACGKFCASGLLAKVGVPIPGTVPDCCGNTEAKPGQSCELCWALLSVIVDFVSGT